MYSKYTSKGVYSTVFSYLYFCEVPVSTVAQGHCFSDYMTCGLYMHGPAKVTAKATFIHL